MTNDARALSGRAPSKWISRRQSARVSRQSSSVREQGSPSGCSPTFAENIP